MAERNSPRSSYLAIGVVVVITLGGFALYRSVWHQPQPIEQPKETKLSAEQALELIDSKNRAIAHLENAELEESQKVLDKIVQQLPDQLFGPVNLAIAKLLVLDPNFNPAGITEAKAPQKFRAALADAERAVEVLLKKSDDSAISHFLAAKLARLAHDESAAISHLEKATKLAPKNAAFWYQMYLVGQRSKNVKIKFKSAVALKKAFELSPGNLMVLTEVLNSQLLNQDPDVARTLDSAKKTLRPFQESVQKLYRQDLSKLLDDAKTAAENNDLSTARRNILGMINLIRGEGAFTIDQRRILPHLLEFVVQDFDSEFYADIDLPIGPKPIVVKFTRASDEEQLPASEAIRTVELADFDLDGQLDVLLADEKNVQVYGRLNDQNKWRILAEFPMPFVVAGMLVADLDRDVKANPVGSSDSSDAVVTGPKKRDVKSPNKADPEDARSKCLEADVDLIVYGVGGAVVLENRLDVATGQRSLKPVQQDAVFDEMKSVLTGALADLDHDGDLDLVFSTDDGMRIWSNRDNFTFKDVSARSDFPPGDFKPTVLLPVDLDRNVAIDILAGSATSPGWGTLENIFHGRFRWQLFDDTFGSVGNVTALSLADVDSNASWDPIVAGIDGITVVKTETSSSGIIRAVATDHFTNEATNGLKTWDYNNDGFLDIVSWNESNIFVYRGQWNGRFVPISNLLETLPKKIVECVVGDLDADGDEDLLVVTPDRLVWYINEGGNQNHWIDIALRADQTGNKSQRCSIAGIGSLLEIKTGTSYQPRVVGRQKTHFGLGEHRQADVVRVLWSNGIPQNELKVRGDQVICAEQHLKGSCPYLYTWTGEKYEFLTDLLWAAPIGLQFGEWTPAPSRAWEYLKIPGDRLVEQDGEYRLQITEELWEAGYFDSVKLLAVDHPPDVEIFSNEKVGPAEIAEYKVHTVRQRRTPVSAHDQHGRDVLATVAKRDENYLKSFGTRIKQGLTPEHFLELDLGKLDDPQQVTLFLTGWVFPTDTSINIAISQNPDRDPPRPPSIQVPDKNGNWKEAIAYMGFPGGKTKTIAVELSGDIFHQGDYRLRIVTTMELYWDEVFFTVDEQEAPIQIQNMPLISADLHYRGYSKRIFHPQHGPESYDYGIVSQAPHWPPMNGHFTRYGDVTEIVGEPDDRLVIMGAGDEMTLRFTVEAPPPADNWKRDFLLYNVGWDKDADLNTIYGQAVEPLPFRAMNGYPDIDGLTYPDTQFHRAYLETYQTRRQKQGRFWKFVRDYK